MGKGELEDLVAARYFRYVTIYFWSCQKSAG